jgi:hypothetical protein
MKCPLWALMSSFQLGELLEEMSHHDVENFTEKVVEHLDASEMKPETRLQLLLALRDQRKAEQKKSKRSKARDQSPKRK